MAELEIDSANGPSTYQGQEAAQAAATTGQRWTFFTNHAHVLILLYQDAGLLLREIAVRVGITERAVQRIVHELKEGGFLERERVGRRNHYRVLADKPLRHTIEAHCKVEDVLRLVDEASPANDSASQGKR